MRCAAMMAALAALGQAVVAERPEPCHSLPVGMSETNDQTCE